MKKDLMILLNELYLSDKTVFNVRFPFYNLNLFTVDVKNYKIRKIVNSWNFDKARTKYIPESDFLSGDLPRYSDFRDCLITSTFLPFPNYEEVKLRLLDLAEGIMSPEGRSKPLYLALDTNLVYLKLFSRYFPLKGKNGKTVTAIDFRIALSDMVKEEIDTQIKLKYRSSNIKKMKTAFGHKDIADQFINASCRKTRIAKSAQNEIKLLFAALEAERAESQAFIGDKEERDRIIAKSYADFERDRGGEVLLLTADEDMAYHAKNAGLLQETLLVPHDVPSQGIITPCQLVDLLFDLAIYFGVIRLSGTGVTIFGEWKGKGFKDYSLEHLNVRVSQDSIIREEFHRSLRIAQKIDGLV
jgi:hypothetical protein